MRTIRERRISRRMISILATIGLSTSMLVASIPAEAVAKPLLRDYFSSASDTNWTFLNRVGEIKGGALWIDGPYKPNPVGRDGFAVTHVGDQSWSDYSFSVSYDSTNLDGCCGVNYTMAFVRVADVQGKRPATDYRIDVAEPGNPGDLGGGSCSEGGVLPEGMVLIIKQVDGVTAGSKIRCASNSVTGTNLLRVVADGPTIRVFINGERVIGYTDPDPIGFGGVGVGQIWETNGSYDNAVVRPLTY